ncbi:MAG: phosphotransferase family protein [Mycobacteriales bacterium]
MPEVDPSAVDRLLGRIFGRPPVRWERTSDGVSTEVYRIFRGEQIFYLRLPVDDPGSFAAEAAVHTELRRLGAAVPEVVHYALFDEGLRRSLLVTTEIPGRPMTSYGDGGVVNTDVPAQEALPRIYRAAGRDLALVNQIAVDGFGWIQNGQTGWPLHAEHRDFARWLADFDAATLRRLGFSHMDVERVEQIVADEVRHAPPPGHGLLAHGDFYVSHVFHRDGHYTGMIDFGSIQGSNGWHDLATFRLSDPEQDFLEEAVVPHLEAGYAEVADVPPDFHARVLGTAVTITAERLVRQYLAEGEAARGRASFRIFLHHLHRLLRERAG